MVPRRSRKPKRPKADASADCLMRYQLAMATWAELNVEYQRAQSARTKLLVAQAGKRRPPRPASANLDRAERRRNSPAQQSDNARRAHKERALRAVSLTVARAGSTASSNSARFPDWETELVVNLARARAAGVALPTPPFLTRPAELLQTIGGGTVMCSREPCIPHSNETAVAPLVTLFHGTTRTAALSIFNGGFKYSRKGRAIPPGTTVHSQVQVVCCGVRPEVCASFASAEAVDVPGCIVVVQARLVPGHYAVSACSGGTVALFHTGCQYVSIIAVLQLSRICPRMTLRKLLSQGRSSDNKATWEQSPTFESDMTALLCTVELPIPWKVTRDATWRRRSSVGVPGFLPRDRESI